MVLLGAAVPFVGRTRRTRSRPGAPPPWRNIPADVAAAEDPPPSPQPEPEAEPEPATQPGPTAQSESAGQPDPDSSSSDAWIAPCEGECPESHPVKIKRRSGIFHLPGMVAYNRTKADRCYRDPASATADGYRVASR